MKPRELFPLTSRTLLCSLLGTFGIVSLQAPATSQTQSCEQP